MISNTELSTGLVSVLPGLLAISITLITRKIFLGLGMGIIVGALVAHGGNPAAALFAIVTYLSSAVLDQSHTIYHHLFLIAGSCHC
tara:strand:+ start:1157 stop:1414 length:258 start_codon:yes stop_codon:yes gene_type:complete